MLFGTFDRLHPGHVFLIEEASRLGKVTVVVAQDETVLRIKGRKPRESLTQRKKVIEQRFPGAKVIAGSARDFLEPIRTHQPDIILLGYDQKLPPGVTEGDLPKMLRAKAHKPEKFKSSLMKLVVVKGES